MRRFITKVIAILTLALPLAVRELASADPVIPDSPATQPTQQIDSPSDPDYPRLEKSLDKKLPQVMLSAVTVGDSIDFMRDVTALNLCVDWKTLALAGVDRKTPVSVSRKDIPIRDALTQILSATGSDWLDFHVANGIILISTKLDFEDRKKQVGPYLTALSDVEGAAPFLNKRLAKVELASVSLSEALTFLRDITNTEFTVRWKVLKAAGIGKNTPVALQLSDFRLTSAIFILLDQAGGGKLGYTAVPIERPGHDRNHNPITVKTVLITISTVNDLLANPPTTQPRQ